MKNSAAIESLRTFAITHNEIAFAHMCTAALDGEEWATVQIAPVLRAFRGGRPEIVALDAIRATNTTRPDGAVARTLEVW
jgi:hypothetical protein